MMCRTVSSSMIVFSATQSGSVSGETVGRSATSAGARQHAPARVLSSRHVHHQPDLPLGRHRPLEHQDQVVHLLPLPRVGGGGRVGDEPRRAVSNGRRRSAGCSPAANCRSRSPRRSRRPARGGFTSVAPQLNSTCARRRRATRASWRVMFTTSVAIRLPCRSFGPWIGESFGTASTHRTGRRLTLLKTNSASSTHRRRRSPRSSRARSARSRASRSRRTAAISCARISVQWISGSSMAG